MTTKEDIENTIYAGDTVDVSEEDYQKWARSAIQDIAGKFIDTGEGLRGMIALQEVRRLDIKFGRRDEDR